MFSALFCILGCSSWDKLLSLELNFSAQLESTVGSSRNFWDDCRCHCHRVKRKKKSIRKTCFAGSMKQAIRQALFGSQTIPLACTSPSLTECWSQRASKNRSKVRHTIYLNGPQVLKARDEKFNIRFVKYFTADGIILAEMTNDSAYPSNWKFDIKNK